MKRSLLLIPGLFFLGFITAQPTIIFQEQFDGGIPDTWEVSPGAPVGAAWQWSANGEADSASVNGEMVPALFWGASPPINSPSADNGAAMYNSDVYDSGGINAGQGPYASSGGTNGTLTAPSTDCSGEPIVYLSFYQYARANSTVTPMMVEVSNDGGTNWVEFPINRSVSDNRSSPRDDLVLIDISEVAAGQQNVRFRFTWDGRYYFWLIDDVQLISPPKYALSVDTFFYTPASFAQPVSQIATDTFAFNIDVSNLGSEPIPNLVFKGSVLEVVGNNTQLIYEDSLVLDEFPALTKDSNLQISQLWAPVLEQGNYQMRFEVYAQDQDLRSQDYTPLKNVRTAPFLVNAAMFAKEDGGLDFIGFRPNAGGDYAVGNYYQMSALSASNFQIRELRFAAAKNASDGPLAGDEVTLLVYKVKEEVATNWANFDETSDESLVVVGFGTYEFSPADENFDIITAQVSDLDGDPIVLEPGGRYFVVASYVDQSNAIFHAFDDDIDYFQVSTITFRDEWFLAGFGPRLAAILRMVIELNPNSTGQTPLDDNALALFPNPSSELLQVQLDLEKASPALLIMANMEGQVLNIREYDNIQKETLQFDVSELPAGAYMLRVSTEAGTKTKPFIVAK